MSENEIPQSMLARVQRCLEQAKHFERHGEEGSAKAAYERADAIMTKYAIDRALVEFSKDRSTREEPVSVEIEFADGGDVFAFEMGQMFAGVVRYNRCRGVIRSWAGKATIIGFPADVEYVQMLWAGILLAFSSRINPKWDTERPADENIKILKEAGRKWAAIAEDANANGFPCTPNDGRLKAAYRRQCKLEGVEPTAHTQRNEAYRASYAKAFSTEIRTRLRHLSKMSKGQEQARGDSNTALALRSRDDDVMAKFYEMFPHHKPLTDEEQAKLDADIEEARLAEELRRTKLTDKQREAEDTRNRRQQARDQAQWEREQARTQDRAGSKAGAFAARTVDLGSGKVGTGRHGEISS